MTDKRLNLERERMAKLALKSAGGDLKRLNETVIRLRNSWNVRKSYANSLILDDSDKEIIRKITMQNLAAESATEDMRIVMAQLAKHLNITFTLVANILNDAIDNLDNSLYLSARKLLDEILNVSSLLKGIKVSGVRPEILIDVFAKLTSPSTNSRYTTAKFLINRIINAF